MRHWFLIPAFVGLLASPDCAAAQRLEPAFRSLEQAGPEAVEQDPASVRPASTPAGAVGGALLGGTVGFFAGAIIGGRLENSYWPCHCDDPGLVGAVYGALIGETVGLATGAHLGNGGRGNLGLDVLVSAGTAVLGVAMFSGGDGTGVLAVPVAQLVTVVLTETSVGKAKAEGR